MKSNILFRTGLLLMVVILSGSCNKSWLEAKPNQALAVPNTIKDLQALLDNTTTINTSHFSYGEQSADDHYVTDTIFNSANEEDRNVYSWAATQNFWSGGVVDDRWRATYESIFLANTVLEKIEKINSNEQTFSAWANVKGSALFVRAYAFFNLAQIFCKQYDSNTASTDLGIILRLASDINLPSKRATVKETYDRIIGDLKTSLELLPNFPEYKTRPSKHATLAMLARVYLAMEVYDSAFHFANECLLLNADLMDYNVDINPNSNTPFQMYNKEVIYHTRMDRNRMLTLPGNSGIVDSALYMLYDVNDLRRPAFFRDVSGRLVFKGTYNGSTSYLFNGLATDEVFLIRAECNARLGNKTAAMTDLNTLMEKRWNNLNWTPFTAVDEIDALKLVLNERRKELCFRNIRWSDIRRLNTNVSLALTLKRSINNQIYELPPNDDRYVLPIPRSEILYSNVPQNPR